jgi:hypothetical protein
MSVWVKRLSQPFSLRFPSASSIRCCQRCRSLASRRADEAQKAAVMRRWSGLMNERYDLYRPAQLAELATAFVMLADPLSSYAWGATIAVTGGKPLL